MAFILIGLKDCLFIIIGNLLILVQWGWTQKDSESSFSDFGIFHPLSPSIALNEKFDEVYWTNLKSHK